MSDLNSLNSRWLTPVQAFVVVLATTLIMACNPLNAADVIDPTRPGHWQPPVATVQPAPKPRLKPAALPPAEPLRLSGLMTGAAGSSALINSQWVKVGDRVAGATVLSIEPGVVWLQQRGQRVSVRLSGSLNSTNDASLPPRSPAWSR